MTFPPPPSQDAYALGEVFIGSKENSYTVLSGLPPSTQGYHWNHGITIVTPDRKFLFACETEAEQRDWIAAFQRVINRPMRPQEYAGVEMKLIHILNDVVLDARVILELHDVCVCVCSGSTFQTQTLRPTGSHGSSDRGGRRRRKGLGTELA